MKYFLIAILLLAVIGNVAYYGNNNYEYLCTSHYLGSGNYYGGCASKYLEMKDRRVALFDETAGNLLNMASFLNIEYKNDIPAKKSCSSKSSYMGGYWSARLFPSSFLPALTYKLFPFSGGLFVSYFAVNIALWLLSIYFIFKLSHKIFDNIFAAWVAAILMAMFPVYSLMFNSLKVQYAGSVILLAGIWLVETQLCRHNIFKLIILTTAFWIISTYCAGGHALVMLYVIVRVGMLFEWDGKVKRVFVSDVKFAKNMGIMFAMYPIAVMLCMLLNNYHGISSVLNSKGFVCTASAGEVMKETWLHIITYVQGGDVSKYKFMNYEGYRFFKVLLPVSWNGFLRMNIILVCLSVPAILFQLKHRHLFYFAVSVFFVALTPWILTSWAGHYGYCSAPPLIVLMIIVSGFLGRMLESKWVAWKCISLIATLMILYGYYWYGDYKTYLANYFSCTNFYQEETIIVYHGENKEVY